MKSLALFLGTVLVVWPAAILRLSFVKAYAVMAYLALMRECPGARLGFIETWRGRIFDSPLEWMLILVAAYWWDCEIAGRLLSGWAVRGIDARWRRCASSPSRRAIR